MKHSHLRMRQVHLDFHTSPDIPDVGADWDAKLFARTLKEARVNSINIFAKCHHGMNYTARGHRLRFSNTWQNDPVSHCFWPFLDSGETSQNLI